VVFSVQRGRPWAGEERQEERRWWAGAPLLLSVVAGLSRCPDLKAAPRDRKLYLVLRFTVIKYIARGECAAGPMNHFMGWLF